MISLSVTSNSLTNEATSTSSAILPAVGLTGSGWSMPAVMGDEPRFVPPPLKSFSLIFDPYFYGPKLSRNL